MSNAAMHAPDWINAHRLIWVAKPCLRRFYKTEYFDRVVSALPVGTTLEIGSGPGFFTGHHRCSIVSDVTPADHIDRVADVHHLPFEDETFDAVVGIDVLHHFTQPLRALTEISRVLRPNGRLVLIEPWTTPVGRLFFRHVHHEQCFAIADPWGAVFPPGKNPMDGNAEIPRTYFELLADETQARTQLRLQKIEVFGFFGYFGTGGFTRFQLGDTVTSFLMAVDHWTPNLIRKLISLKSFIVAEKTSERRCSSA